MSKLALKIVEAIQHSLLGSLLVNLIFPITTFSMADGVSGGYGSIVPALLLAVIGIAAFWAWILGTFARGTRRTDRFHKEAANGFDVWMALPEGGLRPPAFIRAVVIFFGRDPQKGQSLAVTILVVLFFLFTFCVFTALGWVGDRGWQSIHPWLGSGGNREPVATALAAILSCWFLSNWATRQRANLAPLS